MGLSPEDIKSHFPGEPTLARALSFSLHAFVTSSHFLSQELANAQFVKDHWHMKNRVWPEHIGDVLYNMVRPDLEGALNCTTKEQYDTHVSAVYCQLKSFPEYVKYFLKYFDDPDSIAKYLINSIRDGQGLITSAPAEQTHASNEVASLTKLTGLVTPEEQMLELTRRSDHWVRRDLEDKAKLELEQHRLGSTMIEGSPEHKALMCLYHHPREKHFLVDWKRKSQYCAVPVYDEKKMLLPTRSFTSPQKESAA